MQMGEERAACTVGDKFYVSNQYFVTHGLTSSGNELNGCRLRTYTIPTSCDVISPCRRSLKNSRRTSHSFKILGLKRGLGGGRNLRLPVPEDLRKPGLQRVK